MSTTTSTYLSISQNLTRYQLMIADQPTVKTASKYYAANIGNVTSISEFVGNYRLLSYALDAYGLGDQVNNTGLVTQVLEGGVSNPKALANTLSNPNWAKFAAAFNFASDGASAISPISTIDTIQNYVEQKLETQEGAARSRRPTRALFPARRADDLQPLSILGDTNLHGRGADDLQSAGQFGRHQHRRRGERNRQRLMPMSELQNPNRADAAHRALCGDVRCSTTERAGPTRAPR